MADARAQLRSEFQRWERAGLRARFWLRDDDAIARTEALLRLEELGRIHRIMIGLSLVPGKLEASLVEHLARANTGLVPMCHGWVHANYGSGVAPDEFGSLRPVEAVIEDGRKAHEVFARTFPGQPVIFVPPYGNLAPAVKIRLPALGFDAISNSPGLALERMARLHSRYALLPPNPLRWVAIDGRARETDLHAHIDVIDWRRQTAQRADDLFAAVLGELRLRRKRYIPVGTPIGILSHHLVHDEPIWDVLHELLAFLASVDAACFPNLEDLVCKAVSGTSR